MSFDLKKCSSGRKVHTCLLRFSRLAKTAPQKQHSLLGGSPVDIPEEEEDDTDLGVKIRCGEFNDEVSRLGENCGDRLKREEESGKHIEGETKAAVEVDAVLLRFCGLSGVTNPGRAST